MAIACAMPWPAHDGQGGTGVVLAHRKRLFAGLTKNSAIAGSRWRTFGNIATTCRDFATMFRRARRSGWGQRGRRILSPENRGKYAESNDGI